MKDLFSHKSSVYVGIDVSDLFAWMKMIDYFSIYLPKYVVINKINTYHMKTLNKYFKNNYYLIT